MQYIKAFTNIIEKCVILVFFWNGHTRSYNLSQFVNVSPAL